MYCTPVWVLLWILEIQSIRAIVVGHLAVIGILGIQYRSGVTRSLRAVDAQPLEDSAIQQLTDELSEELDVENPDVYIGEFGLANAFAVGRKNNGSIVLSRTLVTTLPPEQLSAVIAHELSHLRSHDTSVMMLGEGIDSHLMSAKYGAIQAIEGIGSALMMKPVILICVVLRLCVLLPLRFVSRQREFVADADAAAVVGSRPTADALEAVHRQNNSARSPPGRAAAVDSLCIDRVVQSRIERLFGTHPPIDRRIKKLRTK